MAWFPRRFGWLLIAYLAVVGYALAVWLPTAVDRYDRLQEKHPQWANYYVGAVAVGVVILGGLSIWGLARLLKNSLGKRRHIERRAQNPSEMSLAQKQAELRDNLASGREFLQTEGASTELTEEIQRGLAELEQKDEQHRLEIVAFGTISSGKSTLLNALAGRDVFASDVAGGTTAQRSEIPWPGASAVVLVDTPGLGEVRGEGRASVAAAVAENADLVLLVVDGPLKAYELELVEVLFAMEKRVLVCLNKEDWYDTEQQQDLLDQIAKQMPKIAPADILAVRACSVERHRMRVSPEGQEHEEQVELPADVQSLAFRMLEVMKQDGPDLLLANLLLQSRGLMDEAKRRVRATLDARADEIVSRHMWAAGSAAGVNPIPILDIAGGSAITVKMVLELAHLYKQPLDADTVVKLLEQLGKNLVAMVGATATAPAVAGAIASLLKTVPGIGTLVGGLLQGIVQAIVTRWIGNVFIEYFHQEIKPPEGALSEMAREQWQQLTRPESLRRLITAGRQNLASELPPEEQP